MLVLRTDTRLSDECRETLRNEVKQRTGEDCLILDFGIEIVNIKTKKEQPLWRRLFRLG